MQLLIERDFPPSRYPTKSEQQKKLAKEAGCSWSTIQRILAPLGIDDAKQGNDPQMVGTKIDTVADLATVFGVRPSDLLTPNFASDLIKEQAAGGGPQEELQRRRS